MTLTIVNHCHALNSPNGKTFIVADEPNGSITVLGKAHGYRLNPRVHDSNGYDYLPPYFSGSSRHNQGAPDGPDNTEIPSSVSIPEVVSQGSSGFFLKEMVMME